MSDRLKRHVARHAAKMTFGDFGTCLPFPANPLYDSANLMTLFSLRGNYGQDNKRCRRTRRAPENNA